MNVISSNQDLAVTANEIASNALKTAAAQATALSSMQAQIGRMGELGVLDFCITQSVCFEDFLLVRSVALKLENYYRECNSH